MARSEREADGVPPPGQQAACHAGHAACDYGLLPGRGRSGRAPSAARVLGAVGGGTRALGCLTVGTGHGRGAVRGDHDRGDPTAGRDGPPRRGAPVGPTRRPGRRGIGGVGGPEDGDTAGRLVPRTAVAGDHWETLPGVLPPARLACAVGLLHAPIALARPRAGGVTTPTVRPARGRGGLLCRPPQHHGDALTLQGAVPRGPSGPPGRRRGSSGTRRPPPPGQRPRIAGRGEGPRPASSRGSPSLVRHRRATDAQALGARALAQPLAPLQTPHRRDVTPGAPLCRPRCRPLGWSKAQETAGGSRRRRAPRPVGGAAGPWHRWPLAPGIGGRLAMASVAACVWNGWQCCRGISGRIPPESVAALAWNTHTVW